MDYWKQEYLSLKFFEFTIWRTRVKIDEITSHHFEKKKQNKVKKIMSGQFYFFTKK